AWATNQGLDFAQFPLWFLAGHAPGLVVSGYFWDHKPAWTTIGAQASLVAAAATTIALWQLNSSTWPAIFLATGFFTAFGMTAWGRWYAAVPPGSFGRAFAYPAAGLSLLGWFFA